MFMSHVRVGLRSASSWSTLRQNTVKVTKSTSLIARTLVPSSRLSSMSNFNNKFIKDTIGSFDSKKVADTLLTRINLTITATVLAVLWLISFFRQEIRQFFINEAVIIGIEALSNEKLIFQTQKLVQSVVQAVLSDKELMAHVTAFISDITAVPETRKTLIELTLHVLQHQRSIDELTILSKRIVENLSKDEETMGQLGALFGSAVQQPAFVNAVAVLFANLCKDPKLSEMFGNLLSSIASEQSVVKTVQDLTVSSTRVVLEDGKIVEHSKKFVSEVIKDETVQKTGGDALFKTVSHALKPGVVRIVGACMISVSFCCLYVLHSPY